MFPLNEQLIISGTFAETVFNADIGVMQYVDSLLDSCTHCWLHEATEEENTHFLLALVLPEGRGTWCPCIHWLWMLT
jgi:hypothetical protein